LGGRHLDRRGRGGVDHPRGERLERRQHSGDHDEHVYHVDHLIIDDHDSATDHDDHAAPDDHHILHVDVHDEYFDDIVDHDDHRTRRLTPRRFFVGRWHRRRRRGQDARHGQMDS
jgi:hypothetical protein